MPDDDLTRQQSGVIVEPWYPGDALEARKLNQPGDWIREQVGIRPPQQVREDIAVSVGILRAMIMSIPHGDYINCQVFGSNENIQVARPKYLRASMGITIGQYIFNASDNSTLWHVRTVYLTDLVTFIGTQSIQPSYQIGDELSVVAVSPDAGDIYSDPITPSGRLDIPYIDLNVDGRVWAYQVVDSFFNVTPP